MDGDVSSRTLPAGSWRAVLSGACASLVGIGLARFAYTPLVPAIIGAHWFAPSAAAYLGAANLAGYLAGALLARPLGARLPVRLVLRAAMLLAAAAFFACSTPLSLSWFFLWRLLPGISGGILMVFAAPSVLPWLAPNRRGLASGLMFASIGLGIVASGTLVPLLLRQSLPMTWDGLGVLSLLLTLIAWSGWPKSPHPPQISHSSAGGNAPLPQGLLQGLYLQYALNAVGLIPHMLFLVDFVARGLGQGLAVGAEYWVLFGLGACIGPILAGHLADRIGFGPALRLAVLLQAVAVALPALSTASPVLILSSLVMGAFTPGIVPLALGRVHELLPHDPAGQKRAWSLATTGFALLQAGGAYGMTFIFSATGGNFRLLFLLGAATLLLSLGLDLAHRRQSRRRLA